MKIQSIHFVRFFSMLIIGMLAFSALGVEPANAGGQAAKDPGPDITPSLNNPLNDPILAWNTFLGGSGDESAHAIATDSNGNIYLAGYSSNGNWGNPIHPYSGSGIDTYVAKLDPSGNLLWNTFLGSTSGSDYSYAITIGVSGNIYLAGTSNFNWGDPRRAYSGSDDYFVAKLDSSGNLLWNTFLGSGGRDSGYATIVVDGDESLYIVGGSTASWGNPVRGYSSSDDAFAAKLDSSGNLIWNSFLGGAGGDWSTSIALDSAGNAFVAGSSNAAWGCLPSSCTIRTYSASNDVFVARLDPSGNILWNTFIGGSGWDGAYSIDTDGNGNLYFSGSSDASWGNPLRLYSFGNDAFAGKLDSSGNLIWNTFLGGTGYEYSSFITVDAAGNVYVSGGSDAPWGNPVRAYTSTGYDATIVKLNLSGNLLWNTFLGGSGPDAGASLALDNDANVYLAGWGGANWGNPIQAHSGGGQDAFVVKIPSNYGPYSGIFYVKPTASGTGSCQSWANACTLQTALTLANSGDEVWVAAGTHKPTTNTADRTATFQLKNGVSIYGGFAGMETSRNQRNPANNPTILSGDLNGNDVGFTNNTENTYHVVTGASGALLDGVTITAGNANGAYPYTSGGGMYNYSSNPTLINITFRYNSAGFGGGGIFDEYSSPTLTNVTFSNNLSGYYGGGMDNEASSSPILTNVTFIGNYAEYCGGMDNRENSGGVSIPILTNVTFNNNSAHYEGDSLCNWNSNAQIRNSIFWSDTAEAPIYNTISTPVMSNSIVKGGCPAGSTCTNIITADPKLGILGSYGGFTQTIPLLAGSSAIDTGDDAICAAAVGTPGYGAGGLDQRNVTRPQGAHCDIGAYEVERYTINGNTGVAGAVLTYFDGTSKFVTTDGSGSYSISVLAGWSGSIVPIKTGYTFTPAKLDYANVAANQNGQNFSATPITFTPASNPGSTSLVASGPGTGVGSISANGRFLVFQSSSSLVAGDTNGQPDIFRRDLQNGTITRISVASDGSQGNGISGYPAFSVDGRFVTFYSTSTNLVTGDTNNSQDIFLRDTQLGTTTRISVDSNGSQAVGGDSFNPSISTDGRYVVFTSIAYNLVTGDTNTYQAIYVRDTWLGTTTLVSIALNGNPANNISYGFPVISSDGRYVAFSSQASNLVTDDINAVGDIFVRDLQLGTTTRVSVSTAGEQSNGNSGCTLAISADGRYVAFCSDATNLVPGDTNGAIDVFVRDLQLGTTTRVSVDSAGNQDNELTGPQGAPILAMSADGRYVAFDSRATNLVTGDTNAIDDVFLRDTQLGTTSRISMVSDGTQSNGVSYALPFSLSADGRYIIFLSQATNLVAGDSNNAADIFLHENGYIISGNAGIAGATITYTGGSTTANSSGVYSFGVPPGWSGTVTPTKAGYTFSPASRSYTNVTADLPAQNFTITSTNADLSNLVFSTGALIPAFAPGTTTYIQAVANTVTSLTITPTVADPAAIVSVNGTTLVSGSASNPINLTVGPNTVTTVVAAQDGTTTKTYTVTVTRAPDNTAPTVDAFTVTTPTNSLNIPITSFMASDNVGVTGYLITRSSTSPAAGDAGWTSTAPNTYTVTGPGNYSLYPWAKDAAGNVSARFASPRVVEVDTTAPDTQISSYPASPTIHNDATFSFRSPDLAASLECSLDGSDFTACTSPKSYSGLANGTHIFTVRAKDPAGNLDPTPASYTWMIDTTHTAMILYTAPSSSGGGDCASWANACTLGTALNRAFAFSGDEIWVAAGVHKPTTGADRTATFQLKSWVNVYGGFLGSETIRDQRDPASNVTILSGDLSGNDNSNVEPQEPTRADNSYHVVTGVTGAILDGFTITAGNANAGGCPGTGCGGGMYNYSTSPMLMEVIFSNNSAWQGGGMSNYSSNPMLTDVTFTNNLATQGGGMYNYSGSPSVGSVTFMNNKAFDAGGGMGNYNGSNPALINVTFRGNSATDYGGGGMFNYSSSNPTLRNVTFSNNSATSGGGMRNQFSSPQISNTIFWGNTAINSGAQVYNYNNSSPHMNSSVVQDGCPGGSVCTRIITADPLLGTLGNYGGFTQTIPILPGSSAIDQGDPATCAFIDQRGVERPQGILCDIGAYEIEQYTISGNVNVAGATITYDGGFTTTNSNGNYSFIVLSGWSGTVTPSKTGYTFSPSSKSYTDVKFNQLNQNYTGTLNAYTLIYIAGTHGSITGVSPQTVNYGANGTEVTAVPNTGYHFVSWSDGVTTASRSDTNVTRNITVTANFEGNPYTLTVNSAHGTVTRNPDQATYIYGDVVQLSATPSVGWSFANWTGDLTGTNNPSSITIHENTSITANYTQNEYALTINSTYGTVTKMPNQATYHDGDVVQLSAAPNAGWSFANWTGDLISSNNPVSVTIHANTSVTANYTQNEYTVTAISAHGTVTKTPNQTTYHEGDVVQLSATPNAGWSFANWTGDLTGIANPGSVTIHGNTSITANYTQNEYTLTVNSAHGTVTKIPNQAIYRYGDVVQLSITPDATWKFANWSGDLTGTANPGSVTIYGNTSITANYVCDPTDVAIAGVSKGSYCLTSGQSTRQSYAVNNGPVKISTYNTPIVTAERVNYFVGSTVTSYAEMMGLPDGQLDTTYWFPWYKNDSQISTQIRIGNVSGSTATVHISIAGAEVGGSPYTLTTTGNGQSMRLEYAANGGPVKIWSDQNIVATERVNFFVGSTVASYTEMMGLPNSQLDTTYWFPWYKNVGDGIDTQIRIGNVSGSTATVHIYIAGAEVAGSPYTLTTTGDGQSMRLSYTANNGPVKIVSDQNIVASERVNYFVDGVVTSYSEMMGLPNSQLDTTYWFPWYKNVGDGIDTQIRIGNVSGSEAHVHVYIGTAEMPGSPFTLTTTGSTQSMRLSFTANDGPVKIVSDQNIVATERVNFFVGSKVASYSEMMGLPNLQLDTTYWFPWYKNVGDGIDTQLRFGLP